MEEFAFNGTSSPHYRQAQKVVFFFVENHGLAASGRSAHPCKNQVLSSTIEPNAQGFESVSGIPEQRNSNSYE